MLTTTKQDFIPASNEPSGCACTSIRRLPRGLNTSQICCVTSLIPRQLATGYLTYPATTSIYQDVSLTQFTPGTAIVLSTDLCDFENSDEAILKLQRTPV